MSDEMRRLSSSRSSEASDVVDCDALRIFFDIRNSSARSTNVFFLDARWSLIICWVASSSMGFGAVFRRWEPDGAAFDVDALPPMAARLRLPPLVL